MKKWYLLLASTLFALLLTPAAEAGCWTCGSNGCCVEQVQGDFGWALCTAVQLCWNGCGCINCEGSGNLCSGTAPPQCSSPFSVCEQHQTQHDAAPEVVPNGESIDLLWLIAPPSAPSAVTTAPPYGCAANA